MIYHLYNYSLIRSLLPSGSAQLKDLVQELGACLADDDMDGAKATLERLDAIVKGGASPPELS